MKKEIYPILVFASIVISCGGDPAPLPPSSPSLVAPTNNEACLDGITESDTQSSVEFQWTAALNALSYNLKITNLNTNQTQTFSADTPNKSVTLVHSEPYKWQVQAIGEPGTSPADSDTWKFYLASEAVVNYAPFPPELIQPVSAATITPNNGTINLRWSASDIDGDLRLFKIYLDTVDGSTLVDEVVYSTQTVNAEVTVESAQIYYWQIEAIDAEGNSSTSGVYSFRTQ